MIAVRQSAPIDTPEGWPDVAARALRRALEERRRDQDLYLVLRAEIAVALRREARKDLGPLYPFAIASLPKVTDELARTHAVRIVLPGAAPLVAIYRQGWDGSGEEAVCAWSRIDSAGSLWGVDSGADRNQSFGDLGAALLFARERWEKLPEHERRNILAAGGSASGSAAEDEIPF